MEVRDLWPESIRAVEALSGRAWIFDALEKLEIHLYRSSSAIVVVTESFKTNLVARGVPASKVHVVFNGVSTAALRSAPIDRNLKRVLGLEGKYVVSYIGTHGMAHKIDFLVRVSQRFPENCVLLLVGDGAEKKAVQTLAARLPDAKVKFHSGVTKAEVNSFITASDVCLVNLRRSPLFKTVIPSKIFEIAALGRPILLGVEGESAAIVAKYEAGLTFEPENEDDLLAKLAQLRLEPELYARLQQGGLRLARAFDRPTLARRMLRVLQAVTKGGLV